ncbi:MAG TPA: hypothetical protein VGM87_04100, partial [Roseomonas sp.]
FYFAVIADATPPVAAAAFAAAAIAGSSPTITSIHATRFGIAGFTVGFAFIYDPGIMLQGDLAGIISAVALQVAALTLVTSAYAGFLLAPLGIGLRLTMGLAGLLTAFAHQWPDGVRLAIGIGMLVLVGAWQVIRTPKHGVA